LVAKYLSEEWFDETRALGADQPERPGASVRVNWVVSSPGGEIAYHTVAEDGRVVDTGLGPLPDAEVTLTASWADRVRIAGGELDINVAFMQGKVKASGNMAKLLSLLPLTATPEYKQLQEQVRDVTEF
jgi:hypothetical protein